MVGLLHLTTLKASKLRTNKKKIRPLHEFLVIMLLIELIVRF